ncbi:hypothetical protein GCM10009527_000910 [Actinomadura nitritigenes]
MPTLGSPTIPMERLTAVKFTDPADPPGCRTADGTGVAGGPVTRTVGEQ